MGLIIFLILFDLLALYGISVGDMTVANVGTFVVLVFHFLLVLAMSGAFTVKMKK